MTNRERIAVLAITVAFLIVVVIVFGAVLTSLSETQMTSFGHWIDRNWEEFAKIGIGAVTAVATFVVGRQGGIKVGKGQAFTSAIATVEGKDSADEAAEILRNEARGQNVRITT